MAGMAEKRRIELTEVVQGERTKLRKVIGKRVQDRAEAEDILQEVFEEFVEAYDLGQAFEALGAWLVRVAQNKILDRFRRQKTRADHRRATLEISEGVEASAATPEYERVRGWLRAEIVDALEQLPAEQRDVFVKHELEGKSFEEIARETGVSINTLLSRKRYAVRFLRNHLKEVYDGLKS